MMCNKRNIVIINGPNLNLLGHREIEIYGNVSLEEIQKSCEKEVENTNFRVNFYQSNHEGVLVDLIQEAINDSCGLILNPAAYGHTSIALHDALKAYNNLKVEVHLSNIYKRESFRQKTYSSLAVDAVISGCGALGYILALKYLIERLNEG